jgi:hypothetical protein
VTQTKHDAGAVFSTVGKPNVAIELGVVDFKVGIRTLGECIVGHEGNSIALTICSTDQRCDLATVLLEEPVLGTETAGR